MAWFSEIRCRFPRNLKKPGAGGLRCSIMAALAWSPTYTNSYHELARMGKLTLE